MTLPCWVGVGVLWIGTHIILPKVGKLSAVGHPTDQSPGLRRCPMRRYHTGQPSYLQELFICNDWVEARLGRHSDAEINLCGASIVNVVATPGVLSNVSKPPIFSSRFLDTDNPSPKPGVLGLPPE